MADFDTRPTEVNIDHYGGDTLTIRVNVDAAVVAGRDWNAQVRNARTSQAIAATFSIVEDATGADVVLASADCRRLSERGKYSGFWDVQLSVAGGDPVTTLAQGELNIHPDVTRLEA